MAVTAIYSSEDLEVHFTAETETNDLGVPGSPVWQEINFDTVDVLTLSICGCDVKMSELPDDLQNAIIETSAGLDFE